MAKEFQTKDSGARVQFDSGMQRDTNVGKPRYDLTIPKGQKLRDSLIYRWAMLMGRGAEKYDARNWELSAGEAEYERFKESAYRHFMAWYFGEEDEDHAAAVLFNINGAEFLKEKLHSEGDERAAA